MPRPKPENKHNELLYEGTIRREDLAWLIFGDPQIMYAEAAGYRDEMGTKADKGNKTIQMFLRRIYKPLPVALLGKEARRKLPEKSCKLARKIHPRK